MPRSIENAKEPRYLDRQHGETPQQTKEREAENRRRLLACLDPEVRAFAAGEFAKLGLTQ